MKTDISHCVLNTVLLIKNHLREVIASMRRDISHCVLNTVLLIKII